MVTLAVVGFIATFVVVGAIYIAIAKGGDMGDDDE